MFPIALLVRDWQAEVVLRAQRSEDFLQNKAIHRKKRYKSEVQRRDICAQYVSQAQQ